MWPLLLLIAYCLIIALGSLLGGWLPSLMRLTHTRMQLMMSFVGGLMMGVALLHLWPHAVVESGSLDFASWAAVMGLLTMFFMIRIFHIHHHEAPVEADPGAESPHTAHHGHAHADTHHAPGHRHTHQFSWLGLFIGLALHTLIDGIALAASVAAAAHGEPVVGLLGLGTFLAILFHKPLDSLSITSMMLAGGWSKKSCTSINIAYALMCPLGAIIFYLGVREADTGHGIIVGCALGFAAGVFLCISLADILPELQFHEHDRLKLSAALLLGVALACLIGLVEPKHAHESHPPAGSQHSAHDHQHGSPPRSERHALIRTVSDRQTIAARATMIWMNGE